jgi:large subunit ribosomal protein L5
MKLKQKFEKEIKPELIKELNLSNSSSCPTIKKIVINSGLGAALNDSKIIDHMVEDISRIAGQKAVIAKSRHDISNFGRLRKGAPIGVYVTLRGDKMWSFYDKLVSIVLPGVRDFRGLSKKAFDHSGNYNLGFKEHTIFLESDQNKLDKSNGIQITIQTSAQNDEQGYALLKKLGMPFKD